MQACVRTNILHSRITFAVAFCAALAFALFLHGALPFVALPTLGQAVWTTGFSQSFVNGDLPVALFARNFGAPEPAAIAFGLAGAYPAAVFIAAGLHAADAYALMVAFWLSVAFVSAWCFGMKFGNRSFAALLGALAWITMPVIWAHAGYSMTSLGIALLPLYFLAAYTVFYESSAQSQKFSKALFYIFACIISVFMDGYSFIMFAFGSSILGAYAFLSMRERRRGLLLFSFPLHAVGFSSAYILYTIYIGKSGFSPAPLDFFRGWSADISFFFLPSRGVLWLGDLLGISVPRSDVEYFGDASVWETTFLAPLFLAGLLAWFATRSKSTFSMGLLLLAFVGIYMALGPSIKFFSVRPDEWIEAGRLSPMMPNALAVSPTGTGWISQLLPGFNNMRAAYRWSALGIFALWCLVILWLMLARSRRQKFFATASVLALFVANQPDLSTAWNTHTHNRRMFLAIDRDLVREMATALHPGERVAFLPYRNDFLVNYLASALKIETYNIGGDKNLADAREAWPPHMREFRMAQVDSEFVSRSALILAKGEADAVVFPYIDMLRAAHAWPPRVEYRSQVEPTLEELEAIEFFDVDRRELYAVARVSSVFKDQLSNGSLEGEILASMCLPPMCIEAHGFPPTIPSQVGSHLGSELHTDGRAGFLLYGPYAPLAPGAYRLRVYGTVRRAEGGWVDVASEEGTLIHARFPIEEQEEGSEVLLDEEVILGRRVEDVEIRLFVDRETLLEAHGYALTLQ